MIIIEKVEYRNFTSTGNTPITIELSEYKTNLMTGKNGNGKTSMISAIVFALYGKSFSGTPKDDLVNFSNGRDTMVMLDFSVDGKNFRVIRGIKPNVFVIEEEGFPLDSNTGVRDLQQYLEQNILRLPYRVFCQIVVLGATFVPFMKLAAGARREFVDSVLDLTVFTDMTQRLKSRQSGMTTKHEQVLNKINRSESSILACDKAIRILIENDSQRMIEIDDELKTCRVDVLKFQSRMITLNTEQFALVRSESSLEKQRLQKIKSSLNLSESELRKLKSHSDTCLTCGQTLDKGHQKNIVVAISDQEAIIDRLSSELSEAEKLVAALETQIVAIVESEQANKEIDRTVQALARRGQELISKKKTLANSKDRLEAETMERLSHVNEKTQREAEKQTIKHDMSLIDDGLLMLKETGIRSQILKLYLGRFVELVNEYLLKFTFDGMFSMTSEFRESIHTRGVSRNYESFSMGERLRLDLAVLFSWRKIIIERNGSRCNILMMDEILDGSLDDEGTADLGTIFEAFSEDENIFVVTHRANNYENHFERILDFHKEDGFTVLTEETT